MKLLYSLLVAIIVFYFVSIFWPLIFIFILIFVVYIGYILYKAKSLQGTMSSFDSTQNENRTFTNAANPVDDSTIEEPIQRGSVIDVEFTERSSEDD